MGKIEKVVVLSVLFLMVVIFVVTTTGSTEVEPEREKVVQLDGMEGRKRTGDRSVRDRQPKTAPTEAIRPRLRDNDRVQPVRNQAKSSDRVEGLLSTPMNQVQKPKGNSATKRIDKGSSKQPATNGGLTKPDLKRIEKPALDPSWSLVRVDGLKDTINPAYKTYQCRKGDTFESVARRFYGDKRHAHFLRRNNEGVRKLDTTLQLLMPCVNETTLANTYKVLEGDSLWSIAKDQYNAGHRWNEIYDANRHVLRSPDDLRQGLELTIP